MTRILSGIKPTGHLTLGNYIGALKHFKDFQETGEVFIFIADLHALTLPIDPEVLRANSRDLAAFYLASGLDPKKATIFTQSSVPEHAELNAILQNYLYMGELSRMTQFKEKSQHMKESAIGLGLFAYPVLMAADIVLYDADIVPVGEDQVQHVEITRDLVNRMNKRYGEKTLVLPNYKINKVGARIMSLSDPKVKMSKSDPKGDIFLLDPMNVVRKKIMSAVTDLGNEVKYDKENKPGISNLLTIYASIKEISIEEAEAHFVGYRYGDFKKEVADAVIEELEPFQNRYKEIVESKAYLPVLQEGAKRAKAIASKTLERVQHAVGLLDIYHD
ncbi:MAG: tryptophan--tRNA ligase [Bacilli bacterium]|nr:tryptophan--tRNA ligase [Bacilli bacterium]